MATASQQDLLFIMLTNQVLGALLRHYDWNRQKPAFTGKSVLLLGMLSLAWFLLRTGTKPTRITYPCQRAAIDHVSASLSALAPIAVTPAVLGFKWPSLTNLVDQTRSFFARHWKVILALVIVVPSAFISIGLLWNITQQTPGEPNFLPGDLQLTLEPSTATSAPTSNIFVTHGRAYSHFNQLIDLMGSQGLRFYRSSTSGANQGPGGLIAQNDVVLLKINSQWTMRGGTNTDLLTEVIQAIVAHPDGFTGEIVVADNSQGVGGLDLPFNNAEDHDQSVQDVVNSFSPTYQVSTYDWQTIRAIQVDEYSDGDMTDGYIVYDTADPQTGIYISYPKFQTTYGTYISFRDGIWNGASYDDRLRVINMPILKSHVRYGVTGAVKHYMGVQSEQLNGGLANGHTSVATGGMGTLLAECGLPTLNIIDAIWINANPAPDFSCGPSTGYSEATRVNVLMASTDPVALDYWAAEHVLVQAATLNGESNIFTLDPDSTTLVSGMEEAFGVWLPLSRDELNREGYSVTTNEARMNVYIHQAPTTPANMSTSPDGQRSSSLGEYPLPSYIPVVQCYDGNRRSFDQD